MKICSKCRERKEFSKFSSRSAAKDGLQAYCKSCAKSAHFHATDPERHRLYSREYARVARLDPAFRNKQRVRSKAFRVEHPDTAREANRKCNLNRRRRDPAYRVLLALRSRLHGALRRDGVEKTARTFDLLGCPFVWLEVHLESLFRPGMTWENQGAIWHIDHIKPCAKFDLTGPEQQKACFHWTNLQPLFAAENIKKGDKYVG